jgi:predicted nucleic acid-binding protein
VSCAPPTRSPRLIWSTSKPCRCSASWLARTLTDQRFEAAVGHLQQLRFERVPTLRLMRRASELRANVSAYDACYVALAERLDCELITADGRLAAAPDPRCAIRVLR